MIQDSKKLMDEAVAKLLSFQNKSSVPIKTRFSHFNEICLGGIHTQQIITVAAGTGEGKSYFAQQLEEDIFNKELNPHCDDYLLVRCNWEMTVFNLMLRKLNREMGKSIKNILNAPLSEEEAKKVKPIFEIERDNRIKYIDTPMTPTDWRNTMHKFLEENRSSKHIVVTIDHIALVKEERGGKKQAMDDLIEAMNELRKEFTNVSFLVLSQLNREIDKRTDIRTFYPLLSDIHNSSTIAHISDVVLVIMNPYKRGKDKYMWVNTTRYSYLSPYLENSNNKSSSFLTRGLLFYHYLKVRQLDDPEFNNDIFVEDLFFDKPKAALSPVTSTNADILDEGGLEFDNPPF